MATNDSISKPNTEQAQICLLKITEIAAVICDIASGILQDGKEHDPNKAVAARELASQIGWLSDVAADVIAGEPIQASAEQWMLPPSFHGAQRTAEVSHG